MPQETLKFRYTANEMGSQNWKGEHTCCQYHSSKREMAKATEPKIVMRKQQVERRQPHGDENQSIPSQYRLWKPLSPEMNIEVEAGGTTFELDITAS